MRRAAALVAVVVGASCGGEEGARPPPDANARACALSPGYKRGKRSVKWNPSTIPGDCEQDPAKLVVDNGTNHSVELTVGGRRVTVKSYEWIPIITVPGTFSLDVTRDGAPFDRGELHLERGHTYVYNPGIAWDYVVRVRGYAAAPSLTGGVGGDRPVVATPLFDAGEIDYLFEELPPLVRSSGGSETLAALVHDGQRQPDRVVAKGDVRIGTIRETELVVLTGALALGGENAVIDLQNADRKLPMSVLLAGTEIASVPAPMWLRLHVPPGRHEVEVVTGKKRARATFEVQAGEEWKWSSTAASPTRRTAR